MTYQTIAKAYKTELHGKIPKEWIIPLSSDRDVTGLVATCGLLDDKELKINELDATDLRDAIAAKTFTAVEVVISYAKAAAVVHQATNCLMDFFLDEALDRARWLDEQLSITGKPVGPLHGVPISVKDHLSLAGHEITAGFASWVGNNIATEDSVIVRILRAAGAVFIVKTTNPQAIMHLETDSFLGPTLNPHNTELTPGGSSGGEGALIAGRGSCIGIGTDIGGSIRVPAANCGIYGFKPTSIRLPKYSNRSAVAGQESIAGAIGPMARSCRDLSLFVTAVLGGEPWKRDPTNVGMPWRPEEIKWKGGNKPRIGVMWNDGVVDTQPPMKRALDCAVQKLRAADFEVIDYSAYKSAEAWALISSLYFTDGGQCIIDACAASGEPLLPLTSWIIDQNSRNRSTTEVWEMTRRREAFRVAYAEHFENAGIDVILCPPSPGCAPALGTSRYWSYTAIFNLIDYPAGVFPTSMRVRHDDHPALRNHYMSKDDEAISSLYAVDQMLAAPLSLQVVGGRWQDEKVILAIDLISDVVNRS